MTSLLPAPARPASARPAHPVPPTHPRPDTSPHQDRRRLTRVPTGLLAGLLAGAGLLAVLVAALLGGGGAPAPATPGLPDAGAAVGWGQPVVELLGRCLAVLTVGSLLVAAVLLPGGPGVTALRRRALRTSAAAAAAWAACEGAGLVLLTASLLGRPVTRLVPADVLAVVTGLPAGRTALVLVAMLGVLAVAASAAGAATSAATGPGAARAVLSAGAWPARGLLIASLVAVVLPVTTSGHPAAAGDHVRTVTVLAVHVVAASLWLGGLVGVLLLLRGTGPLRVAAVRRLSRLALVCVVAVVATGVAGALLVTDVGPAALLGSGYGLLLLVKTAALLLLVAAGWAHRRRTLPRLAAGLPGAFVRLAVVETAVMAATLAVAVGLSTAPPPAPAAQDPVQDSAPAAAQGEAQDPGAAPAAAQDEAAGPEADGPAVGPAEDMSGHDHGDLSVAVLVDGDRFHVGDPVTAGAPVTVYNTGPQPVALRADDGGFDVVVPPRTFLTFTAPGSPGDHPFGDPSEGRYRDVLRVLPPTAD